MSVRARFSKDGGTSWPGGVFNVTPLGGAVPWCLDQMPLASVGTSLVGERVTNGGFLAAWSQENPGGYSRVFAAHILYF